MRLVARAGQLAAAARSAASVISDKTAKQIKILGTLLIGAELGLDQIGITGSNLTQWATGICPGTVAETGAAAVSAAPFAKFVANLAADAEVSIATAASGLQIRAGRARCELAMLAPADFPTPPVVASGAGLGLSHDQAERLLDGVAPFICQDGVRHYLAGVFLHRGADGRLCAAATDGFALVLSTSTIVPTPAMLPQPGVIVPAAAIAAILGLEADEITVHLDTHAIEARVASGVIVSTLIRAVYPDFSRDIPPKSAVTAELDRAALLGALAPMAAAAGAASVRPMNVALSWHGDGVVTLDLDELAASEIPAVTAGHATIKLAIGRLATVVDAAGSERLTLGFVAPTQPLRIDAGDRIAVLAPRLF